MLLRTHGDERNHLRQFESLYGGLDETLERQLILSAIADGLLFEGGLMEAVRRGMLQDVPSMLRFAADEEEKAAAAYRAFALQCKEEEARVALHAIAAEEDRHLQSLRESQGA
jgi:rubrerythrin